MSDKVAIGFRVEPTKITYSIVKNDSSSNYEIIRTDKINVTKSQFITDQLTLLRSQVISVIKDYGMNYVGIKTMESNSQTVNILRCYIEGVVIEALASLCIDKLFVGNIVQLEPLLEMKRKEIKSCIDGASYYGIDSTIKNKVTRESILAAIGSLKMISNDGR